MSEKIPGETGYYVAPTGNNPDRESGWRWFPEHKPTAGTGSEVDG